MKVVGSLMLFAVIAGALLSLAGCQGEAVCEDPKWVGCRAHQPRDVDKVFTCESVENVVIGLDQSVSMTIFNVLEGRRFKATTATEHQHTCRNFSTEAEARAFVDDA